MKEMERTRFRQLRTFHYQCCHRSFSLLMGTMNLQTVLPLVPFISFSLARLQSKQTLHFFLTLSGAPLPTASLSKGHFIPTYIHLIHIHHAGFTLALLVNRALCLDNTILYPDCFCPPTTTNIVARVLHLCKMVAKDCALNKTAFPNLQGVPEATQEMLHEIENSDVKREDVKREDVKREESEDTPLELQNIPHIKGEDLET